MSDAPHEVKDPGTFRFGVRVAAVRPSRYLPIGSMWALMHVLPVLNGLVLRAVFDRVSRGGPGLTGALPLLALFVAAETGRVGVLWGALVGWPGWWHWAGAWLRANLLTSVLVAPGRPGDRVPGSAGEAVARFRDDVEDVVWFVDGWVDGAGFLIFAVAAAVIMARISPLITFVVAGPLVIVTIATRLLSGLIRRYHTAERASGSSVTGLVADIFTSVLSLKTAGAEGHAMDHLRRRNATERADAAVKAQLCRDLLAAVSGGGVQITIGLVLLLSARSFRSGRFSVGDLALFTSYASWLTELPRWTGRLLARHRQAGVALGRLATIDASQRVAGLAARPNVDLGHPADPPSLPAGDEALERLDLAGVTICHPDGEIGVRSIDLSVTRGSFTVVTGAVGSGKSTLVRGLLGLLPTTEGVVSSNGAPVADATIALRPPRVAYVAQIPRLLSASLAENLSLGWPASTAALIDAVGLAQLGAEVTALADGLDTLVGPRGSRLSGGQAQRATVARALVRQPDLLIIDDASSALDVETEARLWSALAGQGFTCLVVSHRIAALEQADQVIVLDAGRLVDAGPLPELLVRCPEMRRLWSGELFDEVEEGATTW